MIGIAKGLATVVVTFAAVPLWSAPGAASPVTAPTVAGTAGEIVEEVPYDGCTFRLTNRYSAGDGTHYLQTRQVWSEDCTFGSRNWSIRVRVCIEGPDGKPGECSQWLMPTSERGYADLMITRPRPRESIHFVEIRGVVKRFDLAAPEVDPAPSPEPDPPQQPPASTPTASPVGDPGPATTGGATTGPVVAGSELAGAPQPQHAVPARAGNRHGLAAVLATGGMVMLGLGGTGIWLLRRGGSRAG
jgi:hypothetical protein